MVDNIIIEKILISKIASLPVLMKSLRPTSFYFFKTIRLEEEGIISITMLMSHIVVATNKIEFNLIGLSHNTKPDTVTN
jgi:hypothetical protein